MSQLTEIASGIHRWSSPHPEWRPRNVWGEDVASFALLTDGVLSLVDPTARADPWTMTAHFGSA